MSNFAQFFSVYSLVLFSRNFFNENILLSRYLIENDPDWHNIALMLLSLNEAILPQCVATLPGANTVV